MRLFEWLRPHCKPIEKVSIPLDLPYWGQNLYLCLQVLLTAEKLFVKNLPNFYTNTRVGILFSCLFSVTWSHPIQIVHKCHWTFERNRKCWDIDFLTYRILCKVLYSRKKSLLKNNDTFFFVWSTKIGTNMGQTHKRVLK